MSDRKFSMMKPVEFTSWRTRHGMTQAQAAEKLGISKRSISTYEATGPIPQLVELACKYLDMQIDQYEIIARLVQEQYSHLGTLVVIPEWTERLQTFHGTVVKQPSEDVVEWLRINSPESDVRFRTVVLPDDRKVEVLVISFQDERLAVMFHIRFR